MTVVRSEHRLASEYSSITGVTGVKSQESRSSVTRRGTGNTSSEKHEMGNEDMSKIGNLVLSNMHEDQLMSRNSGSLRECRHLGFRWWAACGPAV